MLKSLIGKLALVAIFLITTSPSEALAQTCTISVLPEEGDTSISFTATVTGCADGNYFITLNQGGEDIQNDQVTIRNGLLTNPYLFTVANSGSVNVILNQQLITYSTFTITVRENPDAAFSCGDLVPLVGGEVPSPDPCPAMCPVSDRDQNGQITGYHCRCGTLNSPPCPSDNDMRYPEGCADEAMVVVAGICKNIDSYQNTAALTLSGDCEDGIGKIDTAIGCIPFGSVQDTTEFFIRWSLGVMGGLGLFLIASSGVKIMTTRGDPKRLQDARDTLSSAIAGLVLLVLSLYIVRFIAQELLNLF